MLHFLWEVTNTSFLVGSYKYFISFEKLLMIHFLWEVTNASFLVGSY